MSTAPPISRLLRLLSVSASEWNQTHIAHFLINFLDAENDLYPDDLGIFAAVDNQELSASESSNVLPFLNRKVGPRQRLGHLSIKHLEKTIGKDFSYRHKTHADFITDPSPMGYQFGPFMSRLAMVTKKTFRELGVRVPDSDTLPAETDLLRQGQDVTLPGKYSLLRTPSMKKNTNTSKFYTPKDIADAQEKCEVTSNGMAFQFLQAVHENSRTDSTQKVYLEWHDDQKRCQVRTKDLISGCINDGSVFQKAHQHRDKRDWETPNELLYVTLEVNMTQLSF